MIVALYLLILSYFPCLTVNKLDHMMLKLKETVEYCHENEIRLSLPEDDPEAYIKVRQKYSRIRMRNNILQSTFFTICIWTYLGARVKIVKSIVECYWDVSALNASLQNCVEQKRLLQYDLEAQYLTSTNTVQRRPSRSRVQSLRDD
ncbi:hypothetical protein K435DRAFT_849741 [Dendrothele bispora CBS 962.96]|uniref:Uncharacterized protein n=1 Tax=Dendrothele bispora (strain CBS 962.96) TaxID=1314807 RepID=A0A4S8MRM6_DENBC|nr:hypothetical protein K435DRAFT_849741 [Dendrothele bispora CBS 962.96]